MKSRMIQLSVFIFFILFTTCCTDSILDDDHVYNKTKSAIPETQSLKILSFNTFLLDHPVLAIGPETMSNRVDLMLSSDLYSNHDVIILNEVFDITQSDKLLNGLKEKGYTSQTPVSARNKTSVYDRCVNNDCWNNKKNQTTTQIMSGGVAIVTRHKILWKEQLIFQNKGCGFDALAAKGAVYAKIELNETGEIIHIFGTHVQANDLLCPKGCAESSRSSQFTEIKNWITELEIPQNEKIFIGGDFNVDRGSNEYRKMLSTLNVLEPTYDGAESTSDPITNKINGWLNFGKKPSYIDYIFSYNNKATTPLTNRALQMAGNKTFVFQTAKFNDLSDHYPVIAFTPNATGAIPYVKKETARFQSIVFKSVANGEYISGKNKKYLSFSPNKSEAAKFNIHEWIGISVNNWLSTFISGKNTCVRIKMADGKNYWNFEPFQNYYHVNYCIPSCNLRMNVADDSTLEPNGIITLSDEYFGKYYYLEVKKNRIYLSSHQTIYDPKQEHLFIVESTE